MHARTPRRLTPRTTSHRSSSELTKYANRSVPALLTSRSTGPSASVTAATAGATEAVSVTSRSVAKPSISAATSRAPSSARSPTATRAPSAARRRAVAAPIPPAPPVTSAVRPSRRMTANPILAALAARGLHHRRLRRAGFRPRGALGAGRRAGRDRLARRRPRAGGRRPRAGGGAGRDVLGRRRTPRPPRENEIVVLTVPFRSQSETLTNLKTVLRAGQLLVDATVPLAAAVSRPGDAAARRLAGLGRPAGGRDGPRRRARRERRCTPSARRSSPTSTTRSTRTCSSAATARPTARSLVDLVDRIDGLRGVHAGRLEMARIAEALTPLLISINVRHKTHAGIRITGL